jgi:ribosomal protein S20
MPNTKSAARRVRNSERKRLQNRSAKGRLKSLEKKFVEAVEAKNGVIPRGTADRKKSRLTLRLNKIA